MERKYVVYEGEGDWSALYVDGSLEVVGGHYLIDERLRTLMGVKTVYSDAFLRGGTSREEVAPTLEALHEWEATKGQEDRERIMGLLVEVRVRGETYFWPTAKTLLHEGLVYGDFYLDGEGKRGRLTPEDKLLLSLLSYEAEEAESGTRSA